MVTLDSAAQWEKQIDWLTQEVITRLPENGEGQCLIMGTRVAPIDLYGKLKSGEFRDWDGTPVWSYLGQPAV